MMPLRLALGISAGVHAVVLLGVPLPTPAEFDVERAISSIELQLVATKPPQRAVVEPTPKLTDPLTPLLEAPKEPPVEEQAVSAEVQGAILQALPSYLKNAPPVYPRLARERGYEGTVLLDVEVLPSGRCGDIRVVASSGYPILDQAAVRAVALWVFKPARIWTYPIGFRVEIPITFRLIER
jgi:protein TonB